MMIIIVVENQPPHVKNLGYAPDSKSIINKTLYNITKSPLSIGHIEGIHNLFQVFV